MAAYEAGRRIFKSKVYSDFTITCNGATFPAHRAIMCTQSPFFERACNIGLDETKSGVINLPDDDPAVLEKFLSILYMGNYEDIFYARVEQPHDVALLTSKEVEKRIDGGYPLYSNKNCDKNDCKMMQIANGLREEDSDQFHYKLFQSLRDALYIFIMADKFFVPSAQLIAMERFYMNLELLLDWYNMAEHVLEELIEIIDELYTNTIPSKPPHDMLRRTLCNFLKRQCRRCPELGVKILQAATEVLRAHLDFARDMSGN
ncbi:putative BTB domain-containing protein [Seiridium cardinale]